MATTGGTAPPAAATAKTYTEYYANEEDVLNGSYGKLYNNVKETSTMTAQELIDHAATASNIIPKVYLSLVTIVGQPRIVTLHRPFVYPRHPLETSQWDGSIICILGDLLPGNTVNPRRFPAEAFDSTAAQRVPTVAAMDALVGTLSPDDDYLPAPAATAADTELVTTRNMIQVPHKYIHLVLRKHYRPKELWKELGGAIRNDNKPNELKELLCWMRIACTKTNGTDTDPENQLGPREDTLPPLDLDEDLQAAIWKVLTTDLPSLHAPTTPHPTADPSSTMVNVMREENRLARAERAAERADKERREAEKSKPSKAHVSFYERWLRNCDVAHEDDLEKFYHQWCKVRQGERRLELQAAVDARSTNEESAGRHPPIVTKELTEITYLGNLGSRPSQVNDLTKGISPFTCGFIAGSSPHVAVRIERYDSAMQTNIQPTVAETDVFSTKEVPLPTTTYDCGSMLRATSLFLDTIQGEANPHAASFRKFCKEDWPDIEDMLQQTGEPETVGNVLPRILRAVQINMVTYFNSVAMGRTPPLPKYENLKSIVQLQDWARLQSLPLAYLIPRENPQTPRSAPAPPAGEKQAPTERTAERELGAHMDQPEADKKKDWMDAYLASKKKLKDIKDRGPKTTDKATGRSCQICLSWHLKGRCFERCGRASTHRKLTTKESTDMDAFVAAECTPQE